MRLQLVTGRELGARAPVLPFVQAVLAETVRHCGAAALAAERTAEVCALRELRLIQCQGQLQDPPIKYRCSPLERQQGPGAAAGAAGPAVKAGEADAGEGQAQGQAQAQEGRAQAKEV